MEAQAPISHLDAVVKYFRKELIDKKDKLGTFDEKFFNKNNYEKAFCEFFDLKYLDRKENEFAQRYADSLLQLDPDTSVKLELKKSRSSSYWLDLIRYAEIILAKNGEFKHEKKAALASEYSITIFIVTSKTKIAKLFFIETSELIRFINQPKEDCHFFIDIFNRNCRRINCQLSFSMASLVEGTTGGLFTFDKTEIKPTRTNGQKFHTDFQKVTNSEKTTDNPVDLVWGLIEKHIENGNDDFSAEELWKNKGDIRISAKKIREILKDAADNDALILVKTGRYRKPKNE
jgi:hypothetical protein